MKITAITRFKHAGLYEILQRLKWPQSELARRSGLKISTLGNFVNLVRRPTIEQANAIQNAFASVGEYFDVLEQWPETFIGLERSYKFVQTADVDLEPLIGNQEAFRIAAPEPEDTEELDSVIDEAIESLECPRERNVIREVFMVGTPVVEVASKYRISVERIRQIENKALRHLRHPFRIQKINCARRGEIPMLKRPCNNPKEIVEVISSK